MMNQYKVTLSNLIMLYLVTFLFVVFSIFIVFTIILDPTREMRWFALLWVLCVFFVLVPSGLNTPHTISIEEPGKIIFKSLVATRKYEISDLKMIKTSFGNRSYLEFRFEKRTIFVINKVNRLHKLIDSLKSINSQIRTKGC